MLKRLIRQPAFYAAIYAWLRGIVPLFVPTIPPLALTLTDSLVASLLTLYTGGKVYAGIQADRKEAADRDLALAKSKAGRYGRGPNGPRA